MSGMWEDRTRFDRCGGTITRVWQDHQTYEGLWLTRSIHAGTQGLIFVIDSNDRSRIKEAKEELHKIIQDREMREALLLVFANKQDIPGGEISYIPG